jgi:FKBP-type peptidyl-prolyl cis-trans isomerase FklB
MGMKWMMALGLVLVAGVGAAQDAPALKSQKEKLSYALGLDLGNQLRKQSVDVDPAVFGKGLSDALSGGKTLLTEEETRGLIADLQKDLKAKQAALQAEKMKEAAEKNKKEGEAFLAANKKKEGVVTLPSGLQYKILKAGDGNKPTIDDTVVCQYRGTLVDGTEFDSSYKRNQPATFPVKGVIKGWTEALQLMPVGSKWELVIPPDLAYGERGAGNLIGPGATLIFDVELISIQGK